MNKFLIGFFFFTLVLGSASTPTRLEASALKMSASDIMSKSIDARKIKELTSDATLETGKPDSSPNLKEFKWWRKIGDDGVHYKTLTRFSSPASIRGQGVLFIDRANDENDVLIYLPTFKKVRRVETQQQSASFMSSELSYSDLATANVESYHYTYQKDVSCGGSGQCAEIESVPANDNVKEMTGYSRSVHWIREDNFMEDHAEYYDEDGKLLKKMEASDLVKIDPKNGKWMARKLRITNVKNGKYSLLQFTNVKVNTGIPDSTFTEQNLANGR